MAASDLILSATTASPSPSSTAPEPLSVTPGLTGFAVMFAIAVVLLLLMVDMTRRMRRLRYRAEVAATNREASQPQDGAHRV